MKNRLRWGIIGLGLGALVSKDMSILAQIVIPVVWGYLCFYGES